jgi:hypothetical protein
LSIVFTDAPITRDRWKRYAVRMCILNHGSRAEDVERVLDWFAHAPVPAAPPRAPTANRDRTAGEGWLGPPAVTVAQLARLPVFAGVERDQLKALASWCGFSSCPRAPPSRAHGS